MTKFIAHALEEIGGRNSWRGKSRGSVVKVQ